MSSDITSARATIRFIRVTPMKVCYILDTVRGKSVDKALDILEYTPQGAADPVVKVIASATAGTENNFSLDRRTLVISEAYTNEGPAVKRFRPHTQGRIFHVRRRTSHIIMVVES